MAINSDRPVGTPPATTSQTPAVTQPTPVAPKEVHVGKQDIFVCKAQKGDTAHILADLFRTTDDVGMSSIRPAIAMYAKDIATVNHTSIFSAGQTVKVPADHAEDLVKNSIAIQKFLTKYPEAGFGKVDDFDWRHIDIGAAPDGWNGVLVPKKDKSNTFQIFLVSNGGEDAPTNDYQVTTAEAFKISFADAIK